MSARFALRGQFIDSREEKMDDGTQFLVFTQLVRRAKGKPIMHDFWLKAKAVDADAQDLLQEAADAVESGGVFDSTGELNPMDKGSGFKLRLHGLKAAA